MLVEGMASSITGICVSGRNIQNKMTGRECIPASHFSKPSVFEKTLADICCFSS
jgi:hypothetical protein